MTIDPNQITSTTVLLLAAESFTDPRTVRRWLKGDPLRGTIRERIQAAALARGIAPPAASATLGSSLY